MNLELRIALERLIYLNTIRDHVLAAFGPTPAKRARVRNSAVTAHVAERLGLEVSPALGRDVLQAMKMHGWRSVRQSKRHTWKGVCRK